jgi:hypothetical protein
MKNTFFGFVLRLLIAAVIATLGFVYFGAVLPRPAAAALAMALAAAELLGPMFSSKGGGGASLRVLVRAGASLLVWPGFAWALVALGLQDRGARIALAAAAASALGVFAAGHGQGREHARLVTTLVSTAIPVYALAAALVQDTRIAVAAGCVAVAIAFVTAKLALVWPAHLEETMVAGVVIAIVTGFATVAPLWF